MLKRSAFSAVDLEPYGACHNAMQGHCAETAVHLQEAMT